MDNSVVTIGLCDDNKRELLLAEKAVSAYFSARGRSVEIHKFDKSSEFLDSLPTTSYAIALLDICMPGLTGIDVAREIRKSGTECSVIFLTTSREYAVEAFEVDAVQYLIKPYTQKSFDEALDKAFRDIDKPERFIVKKIDGVMRRISVDKIVLVESDKHYVEIVTADGKECRIRATIEELFADLQPFRNFAQPHKSYLVNMQYVKSVSPDGIVAGGRIVPVSRGKYAAFKTEYVDFVFGKDKE